MATTVQLVDLCSKQKLQFWHLRVFPVAVGYITKEKKEHGAGGRSLCVTLSDNRGLCLGIDFHYLIAK